MEPPSSLRTLVPMTNFSPQDIEARIAGGCTAVLQSLVWTLCSRVNTKIWLFSKEYILKRKRVAHTEEIPNLFLKEKQGVLHFSHDDLKKGIEEKTCVLLGNRKYSFVRQAILNFCISTFISIIPYFLSLFFFYKYLSN